MKTREVPRVGLSIPTGIFYGREVLHGIFDYVRSHRRWIFVTGDFVSSDPKTPSAEKVDAVIGIYGEAKSVKLLEKKGIPVVNISERASGIGTVRVLPDNLEVGKVAAAYFLEKHYHNFACTGYKGFEFCRLRMEGFEHYLKQAGHSSERLDFGDGHWGNYSTESLPEVEKWLDALPKPAAVFTCTDDHARRILNICSLMKIRVPEEVSVLGADNDELECELSPIPISSVTLPLRRLGFEAARMVDSMLDGASAPRNILRLPPTGIASRRSTAVTAIRDPVVARAVDFISNHATDGINVGAVVSASGASRRYVERRFLTVLGRTPKQEILRVKILGAKRLLAETDMTMPEIAGVTGFTDSKMLSTVFMREMGISPSRYRKKTKAEAMGHESRRKIGGLRAGAPGLANQKV